MPYVNPDVISWLRHAHVLDVRETLREARVCLDGWDYWDDEGQALAEDDLDADQHVAVASMSDLLGNIVACISRHRGRWSGTIYPSCDVHAATREEAELAAEDAAIALGWRVTWRRP